MEISISLLAKIGSIVVHADEMLSSDGHEFDCIALRARLADPEVMEWIKSMGPFLPLKRIVPRPKDQVKGRKSSSS